MVAAPAVRPEQRAYQAYGAAEALLYDRSPIVGLDGPAGTGKSRGCLEKLHLQMQNYPGARGLILRKTRASLTESALVTWEQHVVPPSHPMFKTGGQRAFRQRYGYPNGSEVIVAGLDKPEKVMSTEFDVIYVQEMTECTEGEIEQVTTRLRNGKMPYQQLTFDCNPGPPTHWIKQRADAGLLKLIPSRHEHNPQIWDMARDCPTAKGEQYLAVLDALTGVRYQRLRKGVWAAAEGLVYDGWDRATHLIAPFPIPPEWPRYWAIDFGFTNPFVCQWWAEDPDGRLYRYREIYRTQTLVEDHAAAILNAVAPLRDGRREWREPKPRAIICDHDAEGRETLKQKLGLGTVAARKAVTEGIQCVAARLRPAGDGRPRLFLFRDVLVERDAALAEAHRPYRTEDEFDGYVWDTTSNRKQGEEPVKRDDHGMDALRYLVAHLDMKQRRLSMPVSMERASAWR